MSFPVPHSFCSSPLIGLNEQKARGSKHTIPNSNVGKESISQTISALEHWRFNHAYLYQDIPEAKDTLHSDCCIKTIEAAKKHDEPKRVASSQALKAAGTSSGELCLHLLNLCHADDLPPSLRHLHRGRTCVLCHLVPAELFRDTASLCWSSGCSHATFLHHNSCAWWQLSDPALVRFVCVPHPHEQCLSWKEGASKP